MTDCRYLVPMTLDRPGKPKSINWGLVATSSGRDKVLDWVRSPAAADLSGKEQEGRRFGSATLAAISRLRCSVRLFVFRSTELVQGTR